MKFKKIGEVKSPHKKLAGMPIQPKFARGIRAEIVIKKKYAEGLKDLDGFSHIIVIFHLHKSKDYKLKVVPFLDNEERGLFATRAPKRPNPIGLSVVKLIEIKRNVLIIENVDMLDETPILDIKPYVPDFDLTTTGEDVLETGWYKSPSNNEKLSDSRFE